MCGIFGRFQLLPGENLDPALGRRQTDTLKHRGPDGFGYLVADSATGRHRAAYQHRPADLAGANGWDLFLGHRRLAILDLSERAAQPMGDPSGRYWLTFNGEIYNFREIREKLAGLGVRCRTQSDTEVLLWACITWGEDCLARLRGMFAFGLVDLKEGRLFLARDRLGKKPLYYRASPRGFQFASELKAILADPAVPREVDPVALAQYLSYGYIPAPRTIYQGLAKLPPAHCAWVSLQQPHEVNLRRYWSVPEASPVEGAVNWLEAFEAELAAAVRLRMISDVPLGAFSSGGLDSTLVVRMMQRVSAEPVQTFAIGFPEPEFSELPWARQAAERYHTRHTEEIVQPDALALLPRLVRHFDEPFGDSSAIPTLIVSEVARRRVTVALSGDGGDELLAGYRRYRNAHLLEKLLGPVPLRLRGALFKTLALAWPHIGRGKGLLSRLCASPANIYQAVMARGFHLLAPDLRRNLAGSPDIHAFFRDPWDRGPSAYIRRLQYVDLHTYLPEDILVKADRASMAASLELRCPLLDHRLVELAANLPLDLTYDGQGYQKLLVKDMLAADLGRDFVNRRKNGFQMPLRYWFRDNLKAYLRERLGEQANPLTEWCDPAAIRAAVERFLKGQADVSEDLWRLLVLAEWHCTVHQG